ncbi:MAG: lytic transglycosylase domain-containing protein [Chloroflexota bacterium]
MREPASLPSPSPVETPAPAAPGSHTTTPLGIDPNASLLPPQPPPDTPVDLPADDSEDNIEAPLDWQAFVPTDTADHLATMDRAAHESGCGVPWHLLAAIARVESDFGRNMATSSAGAVGYGQFLPSSWQSFGNEGNVYDYRDALPAIATYLCRSGLQRDPRAALFAYNHANWYVDLVLDLAVRYDRMAPGAPTPDVLEVGPATESVAQMHYAAGRDVRRERRARTVAGQSDWLGVPWRGRAPGAPMSASSLESTTLAMLGAAFDLPTESFAAGEGGPHGLTGYADRAWEAGLLAAPIEPPVLLPGPAELRVAEEAQWSMADIRRKIERGQPLLALVNAHVLPGHSPGESLGDQPLVLIGKTPTGLVYSDPSFSSSLGYGLELSDHDFLAAWLSASTPRQALAFSPRPAPLAREAHIRVAEPPPVSSRVLPTPALATPVQPTLVVTPALTRLPLPLPTAPDAAVALIATEVPYVPVAAVVREDDHAWAIIMGAGTVLLAALLVWRVRARRSD